MISVQLNSFVHRVDDKESVLALASTAGCTLKRIRRSRHWLLSGTEDQLVQLSAQFNDKKFNDKNRWIQQAIKKALPTPETPSPEQYLQSHPNVTVNQLMEETGCTIKEARYFIDSFEGLHL